MIVFSFLMCWIEKLSGWVDRVCKLTKQGQKWILIWFVKVFNFRGLFCLTLFLFRPTHGGRTKGITWEHWHGINGINPSLFSVDYCKLLLLYIFFYICYCLWCALFCVHWRKWRGREAPTFVLAWNLNYMVVFFVLFYYSFCWFVLASIRSGCGWI